MATDDADRESSTHQCLTQTTFDLALAGIAHRHPAASEREQFLRRAILLYGRDLAARAYPEIDVLGLE